MTRINFINCVVFILVQLCILSIVRAYFETVRIKIKNGDEIIELNWKRTKPYMANRNLPIWGNWKDKLIPIPHLMNEVGDFITYHDVEKSSAVVYFKKGNFFNGLVDTRFIISQLPLNNIGRVAYFEVGGPYINAREGSESEQYFHNDQDTLSFKPLTDQEINYVNTLIDSIINPTLSSMPSASQTHDYQPANKEMISTSDDINYNKPSTPNQIEYIPQPNAHKKSYHSPSTVLHPEILVFISFEVIRNFVKFHTVPGVQLAIMYYITYFNAIDMLFAKLSTNDIEIHINIAGLVIEFEPQVFPYKFSENPLYTSQNIPHLDAFQTLYESLPNYIKKNKEVFVRDSFDFFFMSTLYPMEYDETLVKGLSRVPFSVYNKRKASSLYSAVLGLVVQQKDAFGDYVIATGLIANLMDIEYEQTNEDLIPNSKKCNAIMQLNPNHCRNCLVWSEKSQQQLKKYIRSNTNRCFLLNYPRSLSPYNSRVRSMHPEDQCFCYGFDFDDMDPMYMISIPINKCGVSLKCSRIEKPGSHSIIPLDGTPCGSGYGVCWDKKCLSIKKNSNVDDCKESCPPKRQKTNHEDIGTMKEYKKY